MIVEVTFRRAGESSDLFIRLVETPSQLTKWSGSIELDDLDGTFGRSDVWRIARALQVQVGVEDTLRTIDSSDIDRLAYQSYLRGLEAHALRMSNNRYRFEGVRLLRSAVQTQPDFADAWSVLAEAMVSGFGGPSMKEASAYIQETEQIIARALELSPNDARANASAATWYSAVHLDLERAERHLQLALQFGPGLPQTQTALAGYYAITGEPEQALVALERLASIDPLNLRAAFYTALYKVAFGYFEEAFEFMEQCYQESCLGEGFVYMAAASAALTPDSELRQRWGERLKKFGDLIAQMSDAEIPAQARLVSSLATIWFEDPNDEPAKQRIRDIYSQGLIAEFFGTMGPTLAEILDEDVLFDTLGLSLESGDLLAGPTSLFPIYGANPYPAWVLEHPRYRALWADPRLSQLAKIYRQKGFTAGLPVL
jgi:tetratricopeptide (TPR) repeat protein